MWYLNIVIVLPVSKNLKVCVDEVWSTGQALFWQSVICGCAEYCLGVLQVMHSLYTSTTTCKNLELSL